MSNVTSALTSIGGGEGGGGSTLPISPLGLSGYQWNLPPHAWSLPVEPSFVNNDIPATDKYVIGSSHRFRRGRIYWYARTDNSYMASNNYNNGSDLKDPRYGFQFLWNPDQVSFSVAMNMSITPSFADKVVSVAGAFPSGEYLSFTLRIDRTNDFACIKNLPPNPPQGFADINTYDMLAEQYASPEFYKAANSFDKNFSGTLVQKIQDLQRYGTLADVEYLYKAINGPGWINQAAGRYTSDIGFLSPTLLKIDIGPMSYIGYVNGMNLVHTKFSKNMIPITTDVQIQFNLMATAGLSTSNQPRK
jgi:hypothetical protein